MASFTECLTRQTIAEQLKDDLFNRVNSKADEIAADGSISPEAARKMAEEATLKAKHGEIALRKRQEGLKIIRLQEAIQNASSHPDGMQAGVMSLLVKDTNRHAPYSNIDNRASAVIAQLHAHFADAMNQYRTKGAGLVQDTEGMRDMVRELFGTDTGSASAKAHAKAWGESAEMARTRINRAGAAVAKREDWGMPQYHDPGLVAKVSKEEYIEFVVPLLGRNKMRNNSGHPFTDMEFSLMMQKMYDDISTDGLANMIPGRSGGGKKIANRRQDHRVLIFKDADAWLTYHDRFGHADIYTTLLDHLESMSNDIAKLEIMGPNPEFTYQYLKSMVVKEKGAGKGTRAMDAVWNVVSGKAQATESVNFADFMTVARNVVVSAKLGGAFLSSISDIAYQRMTSKFLGMPAGASVKRAISLMNPANADDRLFAVKLGLMADAWKARGLAANRYTEVTGTGKSAKFTDFVMKASLLSPWTDAGRKGFGMEFSSYIADNVGKRLDELPDALQRGLETYGITSKDWDMMRSTKLLDHKGVKFFSPEDIMKRTDLSEGQRITLATKYKEMVLTETDYAVPTPDARIRSIATGGGLKRGTVMGELSRTGMMFKSFPMTVIATHLYRGATQAGLDNKIKYLSYLAISTTVFGALALQAKQIGQGKDPLDMTESKFWGKSFLQGGGAGIYGDFLGQDVNRFGGGFLQTMAGPMAQLALQDIPKLTLGNVQEAIQGKDTNISADMIQFLRRNTPGGSLWYTRMIFERTMLDQLQKEADPKAHRKFRNQIRKKQKDYGQDFWWKPGSAAPNRAPDIGAVGG
jgi:hypothetical protein